MIRLYDLPKPKLGEETWLRCKDVGPHPRYPSSLPIRTLTIGVHYRLLGRLEGHPDLVKVRNDRGAGGWFWAERFEEVK